MSKAGNLTDRQTQQVVEQIVDWCRNSKDVINDVVVLLDRMSVEGVPPSFAYNLAVIRSNLKDCT